MWYFLLDFNHWRWKTGFTIWIRSNVLTVWSFWSWVISSHLWRETCRKISRAWFWARHSIRNWKRSCCRRPCNIWMLAWHTITHWITWTFQRFCLAWLLVTNSIKASRAWSCRIFKIYLLVAFLKLNQLHSRLQEIQKKNPTRLFMIVRVIDKLGDLWVESWQFKLLTKFSTSLGEIT